MAESNRRPWIARRLRNLLIISSISVYERQVENVELLQKPENISVKIIFDSKEICRIESEQLIADGFDFNRDREIVDGGGTLFYAFINEKLAHVTQVFTGEKAHRLFVFFRFMELRKTVGFATFTKPSFRRRGIQIYVHGLVLNFLEKEGYKSVWAPTNSKYGQAIASSMKKIQYFFWGRGYNIAVLSFLRIDIAKPKNKYFPKIKIYWKNIFTK